MAVAGAVGPKSLFWECRAGDGSERAAKEWARREEARSSEERRPPMVEIQTWGPRVSNAQEKLEAFMSGGFTESICTTLHARPVKGGIHTVYVPDDADHSDGAVHRLGFVAGGEDDGFSTRSLIAGGTAMICFVLFCCASSALNASRAAADRSRGDRSV